MPDLDYRFDEITERYYDRQLDDVRAFAREVPLTSPAILEIGSNAGKFTEAMAALNPARSFIGVEVRKKHVERANERLDAAGHTHARVLRVSAELAVPILFDDGQLSDVFILFPDPWWKERHQKRRVIRDEFLDVLSPKMAPGATLWVRTDVGPLANDMRAVLNARADFTPLPLAEHPLDAFPRSERDTRSVKLGLPVHRLYYVKK